MSAAPEGGLGGPAARALFANVRWRFAPGIGSSGALELIEGLLLEIEKGTADLVKEGAARTVWRLKRDGKTYYVKRYKFPTLLDRLRFALFRSKADREMHSMLLARQAGLNVPSPVACGEQRKCSFLVENLLITAGIENAVDLITFIRRDFEKLAKAEAARFLIRGARLLASTIRKMHDAQLDHRDLHAGNILVSYDRKELSFFVLDLHSLRRRRLTLSRRIKVLAHFGLFFKSFIGLTVLARFFEAYFLPDRLSAEKRKALLKACSRAVQAARLSQYRKRDLRSLRANRYFAPLRVGEFRGWFRRTVPEAQVCGVVREAPQMFSAEEATSRILQEFPGGPASLKCFDRPRFGPGFSKSSARSVWFAANVMMSRHVASPAPLAFWEGGAKVYLLTRHIEGAENLEHLLARIWPRWPKVDQKQFLDDLAALWGELLRKMHERGCCFQNLFLSDILVQREGFRAAKLFIADVRAVQVFYKQIDFKLRARDIVAVAFDLPPVKGAPSVYIQNMMGTYLGWHAANPDWVKKLTENIQRQSDLAVTRTL